MKQSDNIFWLGQTFQGKPGAINWTCPAPMDCATLRFVPLAPQGSFGEQWCHAAAKELIGSPPKPFRFIMGPGSWLPAPQSNIPAIQLSLLQGVSCLILPCWNSFIVETPLWTGTIWSSFPHHQCPTTFAGDLSLSLPFFCSFLQNSIIFSKGNSHLCLSAQVSGLLPLKH